jgi:hypothetical protein
MCLFIFVLKNTFLSNSTVSNSGYYELYKSYQWRQKNSLDEKSAKPVFEFPIPPPLPGPNFTLRQ